MSFSFKDIGSIFKKTPVNGSVLLYNKPDAGTALGQCVALGIVAMFFVPIVIAVFDKTWTLDFVDFFVLIVFILIPFWIVIVLLIEIYWGFLGSEIIYYSDTALYVQQKQSFRRDVVIPWDCITDIEPYDEPILYYALPTHDPTICITYKKANGQTKKFRFGYHLSPNKREIVIERIQKLLVKSFA
jgi:hypothetical protein